MVQAQGIKGSEEWLTLSQVAILSGVGFRTAARWHRRGYLGRSEGAPAPGMVRRQRLLEFLLTSGREVPPALRCETRPRALVVEDDLPMAHAIERSLTRLGFHVQIATAGVEAAFALRDFTPQLVTLDLGIPEIQGDALLSLFREFNRRSDRKVIVISGQDDARIMRVLPLGAQGVLRKPFQKDQLESLVRELIPAA